MRNREIIDKMIQYHPQVFLNHTIKRKEADYE